MPLFSVPPQSLEELRKKDDGHKDKFGRTFEDFANLDLDSKEGFSKAFAMMSERANAGDKSAQAVIKDMADNLRKDPVNGLFVNDPSKMAPSRLVDQASLREDVPKGMDEGTLEAMRRVVGGGGS